MSTPAELQLIQDATNDVNQCQAELEHVKGFLGAAEMYCYQGNATGTDDEKAKAKAKLAQIIMKLQQIHDGLCP